MTSDVTGTDSRKAARRRSYDALMASAKGSPLEAAIARYAAEMGLSPEDPTWESAAPVMFAVEATRNHLLELTASAVGESIGPAIRESLIAIGDEPITSAFVKETTGPAFVGGINDVVSAAQKSINIVTDESRKSIQAVRGSVEWWHPALAALVAILMIILGGFAEARYIRESATSQVASQYYSAGYRAAVRQQHPRAR